MDAAQQMTLLTSTNWELWKVEVKVALFHHGAWDFVMGKTDGGCTKEELAKLTWREKSDLQLRKDRAYTIIYQSLSPEFKPLISNTMDGATAWAILKEHFEPTTRARVIQLLDDFFNTRLVPGENLGLFLCRVKQAAERLREVGHKLDPLYQGYQMIRSLPEEYRATVQAIYCWKDTEFLPDKIEAELLLEENRLSLTKTLVMNIYGRTGLRGRGALPRWGPNHYVLTIITRWQKGGGNGLEYVVMRGERRDQLSLPGGFVPGEYKYDVVRLLFKTKDQVVSPWNTQEEMLDFFKSCCEALSEDEENPAEVKCEMVKKGYMDDPWNTDQAWREVELWHVHFTGSDTLSQSFLPMLSWRLITEDVFIKMPSGQAALLQEITQKLQPTIF